MGLLFVQVSFGTQGILTLGHPGARVGRHYCVLPDRVSRGQSQLLLSVPESQLWLGYSVTVLRTPCISILMCLEAPGLAWLGFREMYCLSPFPPVARM